MEGIGIHGNQHAYYAQQTQNAQKTDGVHGDKDVAGSAAALKFTETYKRIQFAISHPEIDGAANLTPDEMEGLIAAATEKARNAKCLFRGKSIMFDIYALMELIQEIGQKMRDAMRDLRKLENQAIYANIRSQAATQRYAAQCALIGGAVMCAIQGAVTVASFGFQLKNLGDQKKLQQQQGLDVLDEQSKMTQVDGPEAAAKQLEKVARETPQTVRDQVESDEFNKASELSKKLNGDAGLKKLAQTAGETLAGKEKALADAKAKLAQAETRMSEVKTSQAKGVDLLKESDLKIRKAQDDVTAATTEKDLAAQKVEETKGLYENAERDCKQASKDFDAAKKLHDEAVEKCALADEEYETALKKFNDSPSPEIGRQTETARLKLLAAQEKVNSTKIALGTAKGKLESAETARNTALGKMKTAEGRLTAARTSLDKANAGLSAARAQRDGYAAMKYNDLTTRISEIDKQLAAKPDMKTELALRIEKRQLSIQLTDFKKELTATNALGKVQEGAAGMAKELADARQGVADAQEAVDTAKQDFEAACRNYKEATGYEGEIKTPADLEKPEVVQAEARKLHAAALEDVDAAHSKWEKLRMKANNEERVDGKVSPETQKALTEAEQAYRYVRAKQVAFSTSLEGIQGSDLDKATIQANERYVAATKNPLMEGNALKFKKTEFKLSMVQALNQILGSFGQQAISSMKESMSAAATEKAADQKLSEDQLDQIKDLMQQAMSLIQKAIDIFQSVVSKESQTIDQLANSFA